VIGTALPLYHIFSLTVNCLLYLKLGGKNLLVTNPKDIPGFVKELKAHKLPHVSHGLNTPLFNRCSTTRNSTRWIFPTLRVSNGGRHGVQRPVAERWKKVTGSTIVEGYGLSETSAFGGVQRGHRHGVHQYHRPAAAFDRDRIRDDDGKDVPLGTPGEICIRGPQVMAGYWQRPMRRRR